MIAINPVTASTTINLVKIELGEGVKYVTSKKVTIAIVIPYAAIDENVVKMPLGTKCLRTMNQNENCELSHKIE